MDDFALALFGAFVGGFLTYLTVVRKLHHATVIQERQKWRDDMRKFGIELSDALRKNNRHQIDRLRFEIRMRLNPADKNDRAIIECETADEIVQHISVLLKHDWERAKLEASMFKEFVFFADRPKYIYKPVIDDYEFRKWKPSAFFLLALTIVFLLPFGVQGFLSLFPIWLEAFSSLQWW